MPVERLYFQEIYNSFAWIATNGKDFLNERTSSQSAVPRRRRREGRALRGARPRAGFETGIQLPVRHRQRGKLRKRFRHDGGVSQGNVRSRYVHFRRPHVGSENFRAGNPRRPESGASREFLLSPARSRMAQTQKSCGRRSRRDLPDRKSVHEGFRILPV